METGLDDSKYYTEDEFKAACWLNFIMGTCFGIAFTIGTILFYGWANNWY